ncbi:aconitate hydratase [Egibacter rhizosphaerae]|uniref:Aconitate hydratase n=1 Tax=Egibacter rhizosphaerae TaxID=1670831 RepID=A0A411YEY3_9ACTN|nr:aconitate hydratase [Egibacter rhizosphaerae]QBI19778.1 aconitate hydratase [Egibacter rhizosphaerae]
MSDTGTPRNVTQKLIAEHLVEGELTPGAEIGVSIDQTLTQDATGTMVMLELEAMGLDRVQTELSAQYVDHNLLQTDQRNPDDHRFLESASRRFGLWFSPPGNGVSHPVHQERFGRPGATMLGSDSHTCAAGAIGMLAIGAGGLAVAAAMAGEPFHVQMPEVWGVRLSGELPEWVSAKDVILELLRRHDVKGGQGRVIEYYGPGLAGLSAMDRHVIANMGAELGATTTVFPADDEVRRYLTLEQRPQDFRPLEADDGATYDVHEEIDLGRLEPLVALPSSPGNVVGVREAAGAPIYQAYIGSSANPGLRDFAVPAMVVKGLRTDPSVSFDVNPTSRQMLENLGAMDLLMPLLHAGARLHQAGCNGCIGMGQAPATGMPSLRTTPRNFPGRSGTREDAVYLVSPETAVASALTGEITDPRDLPDRFGITYPRYRDPDPGDYIVNSQMLEPPLPLEEARRVELVRSDNIVPLPEFDALPDTLEVPVLLKVGDNVSTDEILPAGQRVLPYRSNIPKISEFCFEVLDETYHQRARETGDHAIVGGETYGQGSSREHAVIAPRYLGLRLVVAKSIARIHWQNLPNFGVLGLEFDDAADYDRIVQGSVLRIEDVIAQLRAGKDVTATVDDEPITLTHRLSERQVGMLARGGYINELADRR